MTEDSNLVKAPADVVGRARKMLPTTTAKLSVLPLPNISPQSVLKLKLGFTNDQSSKLGEERDRPR